MANNDPYATVPFPEAIDYLKDKISLDTKSWRDISGIEHDAFFVSAGAKGSLLAEIRTLTEVAIAEGLRPEEFRQRFEQVAEDWEGNNPWRADLIYRTNLRQAYARGREEYQFDDAVLSVFPYLKFQHSDALEPRPLHKALDGQIFPADEIPFTLSSGYGCGCRYTSATEDEAQAQGISTVRRGQTIQTADGPIDVQPDEGFDRPPRAARGEERQRIIQRVIDRSPPSIAAQITAAIATYDYPELPPLQPTPTLAEVEGEIVGLPIENGVVFDADGNIILQKTGGIDSITWTYDELDQMEGGTFTHNHPLDQRISPRGVSLSPEDIELFVRTNLREMRAVSGDYVYSMRVVGDDFPTWDDAMEARLKEIEIDAMRDARGRLYERVKGGMNREDALKDLNFEVFHDINQRFADEFGLEYERRER